MSDILKVKVNNQWQSIPAIKGDNGEGVPTGGTTGQVLKKKTNTDYDTEWGTVDALPAQSGQSGKYLTTNGTQASWATIQQAPSTDNTTINQNSSNQLQAIGVIDGQTGNADKFVSLTKAQYDALATKDANTFYNITDDSDVTLNLLQTIYPVGSLYLTTANTCPLSALFGTWQLVANDKVLQGAGTRGAVGTTLNESLPNITGSGINTEVSWADDNVAGGTGAIRTYTRGVSADRGIPSGSTCTYRYYSFDASRSSSTYQDNAPVQQDAYLINIYRRTA